MSEYTELVERAEFAATSAKNSAAQTKSDKDTVVSLYNEIKAIIDAGGGGGSCKFYECSAVIEQSEGGVLVSGITGLNGYSDDEVNGLYTYGELTDCIASTGYTHEKGKMWIYKHPDYVFWLITYSKQAPDPGTSIAYCRGEANENPWELASDWTLNSGSGEVVVEQAPPANASWSGYEWNRKEETKTEIDTTVEATSFTVNGSGVSGLDSTFTKSSDTYDDEPVYTNTANMYCWCYSDKWLITAKTGNLSTVYAHSAATSPENPWDATTWYGTWLNENQLTNMVVTADFPTKEVTTVVYKKATTLTEGLSWTSVKPEIGKTYTEDALVEIASLYQSDAGDVLVVSGSYQSDEYGNYSPGAADGEYTLKDTSATGTERVWQNENKTFEFRYYEMGELWMLVHGNNGEYDHYTYRSDNGHNDPVNSDGSSVVWKLQGMDSNMKVVKK